MTNFIKILKPFSTAFYRIVNKSVTAPKKIRKNGKVIPANAADITPTIIQAFSDALEYMNIDKKVIDFYS